jgi:hypothetical protein
MLGPQKVLNQGCILLAQAPGLDKSGLGCTSRAPYLHCLTHCPPSYRDKLVAIMLLSLYNFVVV